MILLFRLARMVGESKADKPRTSDLTDTLWYVLAEDRIWGPYALHRLVAFVDEGRLSAQTQVGVDPQGPFAPAGTAPELGRLFQSSPSATGEMSKSAPKAREDHQETSPQLGADHALLVFATLSSISRDVFEAALAQHGRVERIAPELWLIKARLRPSVLRNALSRRLGTQDALMVVQARLEQAAWFNLDQVEEKRLRALWSEP